MPDGLSVGTVTWITDGDTFDVDLGGDEIEVRLLGVNTPERGECYDDVALDYLIANVKGQVVGLEISGDDQFDRTLASVWLEEKMINLDLVHLGFAIALTPGDGEPYGTALLDAEEEAFQAGRGLWSDGACGSDGPVPAIEFDLGASQFNPPGPDDEVLDDEYIVIVNRGNEDVDLGAWTLRDESSRNRLVFDESVTLGAGDMLTISSGCSTDPGWCGPGPVWNNSGDMALLLDPSGRVVARARY